MWLDAPRREFLRRGTRQEFRRPLRSGTRVEFRQPAWPKVYATSATFENLQQTQMQQAQRNIPLGLLVKSVVEVALLALAIVLETEGITG